MLVDQGSCLLHLTVSVSVRVFGRLSVVVCEPTD